MKVLVLGGGGFVGQEVVTQLRRAGWAEPVIASRSNGVNTLDATSLKNALSDVDAVVNCVAGNGAAIAKGAQILCQAVSEISHARASGPVRLVHMSTQSVYGSSIGLIDETCPMRGDIGWYGQAKIEAEKHVTNSASVGLPTVILRPGCVAGPGSHLWLTRIVRWLQMGWLGDLGPQGDGWSNLVHVRDLAQCVLAALQKPVASRQPEIYNVVAPDSPRWNRYFLDLALNLELTPAKRISPRRLKFISNAIGIPLKVLERTRAFQALPPGIPPSLLHLFQQEMKLDSKIITRNLSINWTPYTELIYESVKTNPPKEGINTANVDVDG